jgi:hypothetical protein
VKKLLVFPFFIVFVALRVVKETLGAKFSFFLDEKKQILKKSENHTKTISFRFFSVETSETLKVKESFDKNKLFLNSNQPFMILL